MFCLAQFAHGQTDGWQLGTIGNDGTIYRWSTERFLREGDTAKTWVELRKRTPEPVIAGNPKSAKYDRAMANIALDCRRRRIAYVHTVFYMGNKDVHTMRGNEFVLDPVVPDTVGDTLLTRICDYPGR